MISERARLQWDTYVAAKRAQATPFGDRDELHRFVVGIHLRGEQVTAPELGELLHKATTDTAERDVLAGFVEAGLALLTSYDRIVAMEDEAYADGVHGGYQV